jgi:hypothetical protein
MKKDNPSFLQNLFPSRAPALVVIRVRHPRETSIFTASAQKLTFHLIFIYKNDVVWYTIPVSLQCFNLNLRQ